MNYSIIYSCVSHIGNVRSMNQDNFICDGRYMELDDTSIKFPLCGTKTSDDMSVFGVFDGLGGEECGEIASYIASQKALDISIRKNVIAELSYYCHKANDAICNYAECNDVLSMGTTAALLAFTDKEVVLCNIGDSKIFRLCDGAMEQISKDHVAISRFGVKAPLSQNLGISPKELIIEPYFARGAYNDGDIYLICSDGLTDMVSVNEITEILISKPIEDAIVLLLDKALENGGKDNVTMIICKIECRPRCFFKRRRHAKRKEV